MPRDANLNELVVAERAVATECKVNVRAKCSTIKVIVQRTVGECGDFSNIIQRPILSPNSSVY